MNIHVDTVIHDDAILKQLHSDRVGKFAAAEWLRLYTPYVPYRTGVLANGATTIYPWKIAHTAPYARYIYNGDSFRFYTGMHPLAGSRWDQRAAPLQKPKLIQALQAFIDRGGVNLNG